MNNVIDRRFSVASVFGILTALAVSISLLRVETEWSQTAGSLLLLLTAIGVVGHLWRGRTGFAVAIVWTATLLLMVWYFLPSIAERW